MARSAVQKRRVAKGSRPRTRASGRSAAKGAKSRGAPGVLEGARSAVQTALRESSDTVKEVGAGLINTAREVITSAVTAQHDAVSVLKAQHREVEALFKRVLASDDGGTRRQLLEAIGRALTMHTTIEEKIFYPAVRGLGTEAERLIDEALEEHHVVDLVLAELPTLNPRDERFLAKMTVLSEVVDHHVKEEERDMFKRAQRLGKSRLDELGARLEAAAILHQRSALKPAEHRA